MISYVCRSFSTPSWWMPDECAKAFRPTIALFGWTGMFIRLDTRCEALVISCERIPVSISTSLWQRSVMTTSSSEVLPARSPMPLIVTSACRAPFRMPLSVLAVAMPRSLWQCVERIARSILGTCSIR